MEANRTSEIANVLSDIFWSDDDAQVVGDFMEGKKVDTGTSSSWAKLKQDVNLSPAETVILLADQRAAPLFEEIRLDKVSPSKEKPDELYGSTVRERARVVQEVAIGALRKFGVWGNDEYRMAVAGSGLRSGTQTNFSEDELFGDKASGTPVEKGGPHVRTKIFAPRPGATKRTSGERVRRSLAHEMVHVLRALTNKTLWRGFEGRAMAAGLRQSSDAARGEHIGGLYVGSNLQGSEAVGELFSSTVNYTQHHDGVDPTIVDLLPILQTELRTKANDFQEKVASGDQVETRYVVARVALVHHLNQLDKLGYGNTRAIDLVALGTLGYSSFEKLPELIRLGVVDRKMYQGMRQVVRNVADWLVSDSEKGYVLENK